MSEIPLHTFGRSRKSRAGYTPLHNGDEDHSSANRGTNSTSSSKSNLRTMHSAVRAAVTSSGTIRKGKQRERYADDPEEEETLLGSAARSDSGFRDDEPEEERRESPQQSTSAKGRASDKSRTIPFRPPDKLAGKYPPNVVRN
ncbi:hypothetical protein V8D89_005243, partial [Ganoderma adspersum]